MNRFVFIGLSLCLVLAASASWAGSTTFGFSVEDNYGNSVDIQTTRSGYGNTLGLIAPVLTPRPTVVAWAHPKAHHPRYHHKAWKPVRKHHKYGHGPKRIVIERKHRHGHR